MYYASLVGCGPPNPCHQLRTCRRPSLQLAD